MLQAQDVTVVVRGDVSERQRRRAQERIAKVARHVREPILFARITLADSQERGGKPPASARAVLDLDGRAVRAAGSAASLAEAVDQVQEGLRHQIEDLSERRKARRRGARARAAAVMGNATNGIMTNGNGMNGTSTATQPTPMTYQPAPAGEQREIVAEHSYVVEPLSVSEAAAAMDALGYDFLLFVDADSRRDSLIERLEDGDLAIRMIPPRNDGPRRTDESSVPTFTVDEAVGRLIQSGARLVFFRERWSGRGAVVYRRNDGNAGLVTTAV